MQLIIFTDLDGTLIDHETYSHDAAAPALEAIRRNHVPLIMASSKTAAEISALRGELGFEHCPAIVENGAGILEGAGEKRAQDGDETYRHLREILDDLPAGLRRNYRGFGDCSIVELSRMTGLSAEAAALAAQRQFSEPGVWTGWDEELQTFEKLLAKQGVSARRGGRFLTLSFGSDKAKRMAEIVARYAGYEQRPKTLALGDAPNDAAMLEAADIGVIVANPHGTSMPELAGEAEGRISRTEKEGPQGWNHAVLAIFQQYGLS